MQFNPIGDLASSFLLRKRGDFLRTELASLTQELATGQTRDIAGKSRDNLSTISAVEHSLKLENGYNIARQSLVQTLDFAQTALDGIRNVVQELGTSLAVNSNGTVDVSSITAQAPEMLSEVISFANTNYSGRYVFAGDASDTKPIVDADQLLNNLTAAVSSAASGADFIAAIDDYFANPTSGFSTDAYQGGAARSQSISVSANQNVAFENTANDDVFRNSIKHLATVALIENNQFPGSDSERKDLLQSSASGMIETGIQLVSTQSAIGASQSRIEQAVVQSDLETQLFASLKNDILGADPFETATKLQEVQTQLESLYIVTSRTSRLNLSEYL
jgi:flagellar hook-associated protein 3 FlgL